MSRAAYPVPKASPEPAIRPLTRDEVAANVEAFIAVARDVDDEYWEERHFLSDRPRKWELSLAVWVGERLVGYAIVSERGVSHAHLHHFMVAQELRGGGLGRRLAEEMIARVRVEGYDTLTLKVHEANDGAQRFYRRLGFVQGQTETGYRWYNIALSQPADQVTVAIHQPNYTPWLGYFHKMARADLFVFLDDAQFSKGSYINRVQILGADGPCWLTQPVSAKLGTAIRDVEISKPGWAQAHLDTLRGAYGKARAFAGVWPEVEAIYRALPGGRLAEVNEALIRALAARLGIATDMRRSSDFDTGGLAGDERLIAIVKKIARGGTYLSGKGGGKYQDPAKFIAAGIGLEYLNFAHPQYEQAGGEFAPGLSVLDAVFHLGWDGAAALIQT